MDCDKTLAFTSVMIQFWSVRPVERRSFTFSVLSNPPPLPPWKPQVGQCHKCLGRWLCVPFIHWDWGEALQPVQPNPELNRSAASTEAALRVKVRIVRGNSAEGLWVEEKWKRHWARTCRHSCVWSACAPPSAGERGCMLKWKRGSKQQQSTR